VTDAGRQARILHLPQAHALGAAELVRRFPVLVAAGLYITTDLDLDLLRRYSAAGGHLILGPRTAYADDEARARVAVAPDGLHDAAGVWYEEFSNLDADLEVVATEGSPLVLEADASARRWVDGLIPDGAQTLAAYEHPRFGDFPAVVTHPHGSGRVTTVGTVPSPALAAAVVRWAAPRGIGDLLAGDRSPAVTVSSGTLPDGRRVWFVFNWGWGEEKLVLAADVRDPGAATTHVTGSQLVLGPWGCRTLLGEVVR